MNITQAEFDILGNKNKRIFDEYLRVSGKSKELSKGKKKLSESKKEEYGFYFNFFRSQHDISLKDIPNYIIDGDFNSRIFDKNNDDIGIDAYYVDEENERIYLYNFKYRHKFNINSQIESKVLSDVCRFLGALNSLKEKNRVQKLSRCDLQHYSSETARVLEELAAILAERGSTFKIYLVFVSNNMKQLRVRRDETKFFKKNGVNIVSEFTLPTIYTEWFGKPEFNAQITIDNSEMISYKINKDQNTYIFPISIIDLVGITDKEETNRDNYKRKDNEWDPKFNDQIIEKNVRRYLGRKKSKYNESIVRTLQTEPELFFLYNNGITIIVDDTEIIEEFSDAKCYKLKNLQIVNGGQTVRAVYDFIKSHTTNWFERLKNAKVLIKLVKVDNDKVRSEKIAEYTNSQNPISNIDLRSNDIVQIRLETFFNQNNYGYNRKVGDLDASYTDYPETLEMVKLGQLLFSKNGYPHMASNTRSKIFGTEYDKIFSVENILEQSLELFKLFLDIKKNYNELFDKYVYSDQKAFYIIYLLKNSKRRKIPNTINFLEQTIKSFDNNGIVIADSRKLIKADFKIYLDKKANIKK